MRSMNDAYRHIERIMRGLQVPASQREPFIQWAIGRMWKEYRNELMNRRIDIENDIKSMGLRLPNGTVNKAYSTAFQLPADRIANVSLAGVEELGLRFTMDAEGKCSICGKPVKVGDYILALTFGTVQGEPASVINLPVAFNPDPRTLWESKPTDKDILYYKEDTATDYVKVGTDSRCRPRKDMVAASTRGRSHARDGRARDDDFRLFHCPDSDWCIMAVADGAGSARYSRKGSETACQSVVDYCKERLIDNSAFEDAVNAWGNDRDSREKTSICSKMVIDLLTKAAVKAFEAVKNVSRHNEGTAVRDYATTLMFAVCKKYGFGWFIASFWVGDGAICIYDAANRRVKLLGTPDEGEYSGQTRFLTMPEIFRDKEMVPKRMRMAIEPDFTALFLMTDGVSDPLFETDRNLNSFDKWQEFHTRLLEGFPEDGIDGVDLSDDNEEAQYQLLGWLDFWSPGNHDDRTLAILY